MAKTGKQHLGQKGEELAYRFLEELGHTLLFRNWRSGRSELDIISREQDTLVISEVKSFYRPPLGAPESRVNKNKQRSVIRGVYGFLDENPDYQNMDVRLDVIVVDFSQYPAAIRHYPGAFYDSGYDDPYS